MSLPAAPSHTSVPTPEPLLPSVSPAEAPSEARWGLGRRIAFRFAFVYLVLYCLPFPLEELPGMGWLAQKYQALWEALIPWVGAHVLRLDTAITLMPSGSGDRLFNYVQVLVYALAAVGVGWVWSVLDRRRPAYTRLHAGLRVYVRYMLAINMWVYGLMKILKTQFPYPDLARLTQPLGDMSPMGLVWSFMGYSTGYNLFTGGAEVLGAVLLCFRRTTTLGALVVVGVMSNVAALNYFYDVPAKLFASHLLLMAGFLLIPDLRRLADFLVLNRATAPVELRPHFPTPRLERGRLAVKVLFLGWCLYAKPASELEVRQKWSDAAPKPALYGIYEVKSFAWNGQEVPPLATDPARWRTVVFSEHEMARVRMMDDSRKTYGVSTLPEEQSVTLSSMKQAEAPMLFKYSRPDAASLVLEGTFGDRTLRILLGRVDESKLTLNSRGFRWINEYPFNR
jgi:uncharacterized membrane protein YphA (DoxX/SURF4 family)